MGIRYNPALDGLRAIAVLAVVEYHASWHWLGLNGVLGVDVFFVLSGFLITAILLREEASGGIRLGAFYLRRAKRLWPALCALVALTLAAGWISGHSALVALFYLGDYMSPAGTLAHTWSLAVEEHYYLLWPLVLPFIARMERRKAIWLLAIAYVAATAWSQFQPFDWRASFRFDTRLSGLIAGSLLAFLPRDSRLPFMALAASLVVATLGVDRPFAEAATACIIVLSYQTAIPFLTREPLVYLGRISYGIYLYHWPVLGVLHRYLDGAPHLIAGIVVSVALAALSFHTIEAVFRVRTPMPRIPMGSSA